MGNATMETTDRKETTMETKKFEAGQLMNSFEEAEMAARAGFGFISLNETTDSMYAVLRDGGPVLYFNDLPGDRTWCEIGDADREDSPFMVVARSKRSLNSRYFRGYDKI